MFKIGDRVKVKSTPDTIEHRLAGRTGIIELKDTTHEEYLVDLDSEWPAWFYPDELEAVNVTA